MVDDDDVYDERDNGLYGTGIVLEEPNPTVLVERNDGFYSREEKRWVVPRLK